MKFLLISALLCLSLNCYSQNLVPNPSFEDTLACPWQAGQVNYAIGWNSITESPDYFNACQSGSLNVPYTGLGYQNAQQGFAIMGFINNSLTLPNIREYFGIQLAQPLILNQVYYASFFVSLSDVQGYDCATNNMGLKLTTYNVPGNVPSTQLINNDSKVYSTSIISDSLNWTMIKGSFVADSAYEYLYVGNFFTDANTLNNCVPNSPNTYYFFDSVCLSTDSTDCYVSTGNLDLGNPNIFVVNSTISDFLNIEYAGAEKLEIGIYNSLGQIILNFSLISNIEINTTKWPAGIYFLKYFKNKSSIKLIKTN